MLKRTQRSQLVPASLVRLRCFINRRGMKVKPWLGPREVLQAFHGVLVDQHDDDAFWVDLRDLLARLAGDMKRRLQQRGSTVDNELLDASRHQALLEEIRSALATQRPTSSGLHDLAAALSAPAAALLLYVGAAVAVGCGGETESDSDPMVTQDAGSPAPEDGAVVDTGTAVDSGSDADAAWIIVFDSAPPNPDSGADAAAFAECNQELVNALLPHDFPVGGDRQLLDCVCLLNESWQTGLADLFAGASDREIRDYLGCCGMDLVCGSQPGVGYAGPLPDEFDASALLDNSCCMVYLGVRCD